MQVIAHNIRSLYNVGAFFRSADGFGVEKLWLTGYTATPPREEISKVALGADQSVAWERVELVEDLVHRLQQEGRRVIAFEVRDDAVSVNTFAFKEDDVLLFGNEPAGVPESLLALCDACVIIPMHGQKTSLNVAVAVGVGLYAARQSQKTRVIVRRSRPAKPDSAPPKIRLRRTSGPRQSRPL